MFSVDVPSTSTPVAALKSGAGMLSVRLLSAVVPAEAAPTVLVTAILAGGTLMSMAGPTEDVDNAAPPTFNVVAGVTGIVTLLVAGPICRTPLTELYAAAGVMFSVEVPSISWPVVLLNSGAGMLMLKLFVLKVVLEAGAWTFVTATVDGGTLIARLGPLGLVTCAAPVADRLVTGMVTELFEGPTVSKPVVAL